MQELIFKKAVEPWELEEVHKLNYETFVEEIPQHERNEAHRLVDKFHDQNTYMICLSGKQLLGMVALRGSRPFSLDSKLENIDAYLPPGRSFCEIRLLAVRKDKRQSRIFSGLMRMAADYCGEYGYDMAIISGTTRQERLYRHMGFVPFGPLVGTPGALYQPMYVTAEAFYHSVSRLAKLDAEPAGDGEQKKDEPDKRRPSAARGGVSRVVNLLPGPVNVHPAVMEAFKAAPISHRSDQFIEDLRDVKRMLCRLVDAKYVELFQGSGTLANDVVATELSLLDSRGLVLSNGEFGDRLIDHATRHDIRFETIRLKWGDSMDTARIERCLDEHKDIGWLWCVHCETSTGMMNDLQAIAGICDKRNVKVCVDAISSVGTVPVSLGSAHLASCVSGKGIGALPGMAMVFHNSEIPSTGRKVPRYLDLAYYGAAEGVPFTFSSNLLYATQAALRRLDPIRRFKSIKKLTAWFRGEVRKHGFTILLPDDLTSPAVTTIVCPQQISSRQVGRQLEERGCLLSYNSEYLVKRNWLQVCLMGECSQDDLEWAWGQVCEVTGRDAA